MKRESCDLYCLSSFERLFETEYYGVVNKTGKAEFGPFSSRPSRHGRLRRPPEGYFRA